MSILPNIVVALSNAPALYPIYSSFENKDYLTMVARLAVALASSFSHLVENHKHNMQGVGVSKEVSDYLNRLDVLGCILVSLRFIYLYYQKHGFSLLVIGSHPLLFTVAFYSFSLNLISEHDKYNPDLKNIYLVTHCLWHITIFKFMDIFLENVIYAF